MDSNEISFENLPRAVAHLVSEIAEIKFLVERKEVPMISQREFRLTLMQLANWQSKTNCLHIGQNPKNSCYKNGKKLYFLKMNF